jgi:hypothetical protein
MAAALLQTQFLIYLFISCVALGVLISLSDTIGSEYIFIDLSVVAIFGKEKNPKKKKKKKKLLVDWRRLEKRREKKSRTLTLNVCSQLFCGCMGNMT